MLCRKLDLNGDYVFGNNQFDYVKDLDAVVIAIRTKILLFYQEWWEDLSVGIPMFESIVGQLNSDKFKMTATLLLSDRIQQVPGVISVSDVDIKMDGRNVSFVVYAQTQWGSTSVEVNT